MYNSINSYPDQQRINLTYCNIKKESNSIVIGGEREDGEFVTVTIKLENSSVEETLIDIYNGMSTLASACSITGMKEICEVVAIN